MTLFHPGDVVRYTPAQYHCREGIAIGHQRRGITVLLDTFWDCGGDQHCLTHEEATTARLLFRLSDYDELDRYSHGVASQWEKYAPADRQVITSQHGLRKRWFIRKGATENMATQIANARREVAKREGEVESAQRRLEWAREDLNRLRAAEAATDA